MAVTSETRRSGPYAGNNSTVTPYVVGFFFLADSDLKVVVITSAGVQTTLVLTTDYVVTGAGNEAGGSFTTVVAVPASSTVLVYSRTPATQTTEYVEADEFPAAAHERALDKAMIVAQEHAEIDARSFRIKDSYSVIAALTPINNALVGLDPAGVPFFKTASEVLTWLQLVQTLGNFPLKTFANAAERGTAVPDFIGQVGSQRDTFVLYLGTALSAGSWTAAVSSVADGVVTTAKLADGALSADAAGRLKMAAAFLMASHLNSDAVSGQTADTLLDDTDSLLGYNGSALRKYPGNVVVPPGSVIQTVNATPYTTNTNLTAIIPSDDTIPQISEGTEILSATITPRFVDSIIHLHFDGFGSRDATGHWGTALFRNPVTDCLKATMSYSSLAGVMVASGIDWIDSPATLSATTYTIRVGPGTAGTIRMNGAASARYFGGKAACTLVAEEIKV